MWLCKFASSLGNFVRQQKPQLYGPRRPCSGQFFFREFFFGNCIHMVELKSRVWEYTDTFENLPNIGQHPLLKLSSVAAVAAEVERMIVLSTISRLGSEVEGGVS